MNVLMQLRKVCNHPDLFESRTIESPFIQQERIVYNFPSIIYRGLMEKNPLQDVNMRNLNFVLSDFESMQTSEYFRLQELYPARPLIEVLQDFKNGDLENISKALSTGRPLGDGLAVCKKIPQSNSTFMERSNTKALKNTTLPHLMQQFNNS
jgi:SNF2 family DNA or RNA helicase